MAKMVCPHAVDLGKRMPTTSKNPTWKCRGFLWSVEALRRWHGNEQGTAICLYLLVLLPILVIAFKCAVALNVQELAVNVSAEGTLSSTLNMRFC
jgi:hypothetical protein